MKTAINWKNQITNPAYQRIGKPPVSGGTDPNPRPLLPPGTWYLVDIWGDLVDSVGDSVLTASTVGSVVYGDQIVDSTGNQVTDSSGNIIAASTIQNVIIEHDNIITRRIVGWGH